MCGRFRRMSGWVVFGALLYGSRRCSISKRPDRWIRHSAALTSLLEVSLGQYAGVHWKRRGTIGGRIIDQENGMTYSSRTS